MGQPRIGTYSRFSTDRQRPTTIEDQQRTCLETLVRIGYEVSQCTHYADEEISGCAEKTQKRVNLTAFLAAWDNNEFDIVITDELSRLARAPRELADIQERIGRTGVHFLTADGLDSKSPTFSLIFGVTSAIASHFLEETRHRVRRSMKGQLERGFMIAAPPFGYRLERVTREDGTRIGTEWKINESEAEIVKEMYAMRLRGKSFNDIAEHLNQLKVEIPRRSPNKDSLTYWRPGTVYRIIGNTIYRGVMVFNGSAFAKYKAKRQHRTLEPIPYARPELRIIDDTVWEICNSVRKPWPRGGGRSPFSGIVQCGQCGGTLTISHGATTKQLYCAECFQATRVGARSSHPGHASTGGLRAALKLALKQILSDVVIHEFRERLRRRLEGGHEAAINETKKELSRLEQVRKRYLALIDSGASTDEEVIRRYTLNNTSRQLAIARLGELERKATDINRKAIEAQLSVDPAALVDVLFDVGFPPERLRAMITRLFPTIVFLGKHGRGTAEYKVEVAPGVALAEASGTEVLETGTVCIYFKAEMQRTKPVGWVATRLDAPSQSFASTERRHQRESEDDPEDAGIP